MKDFRGPLPLDEPDFAEVRRSVLAKIERKHEVWPYALAATAAAAIALVFMLAPQVSRRAPSSAVDRPRAAAATPKKVQPQPEVHVAEAPAKATKPKHKREPEHLVASAGAPPSESEIRMNIETSDPNVRIIWISR